MPAQSGVGDEMLKQQRPDTAGLPWPGDGPVTSA